MISVVDRQRQRHRPAFRGRPARHRSREAALAVATQLQKPTVLAAAQNDVDALTATLVRPAGTTALVSVRALDRKGVVIGEVPADFCRGRHDRDRALRPAG
ncbi:MAG: hypothetical protein HPM95_14655 [Alphaproteobacteria bacterium]|nr:hypothetical protein [Alphaproteobacteria bacterium]